MALATIGKEFLKANLKQKPRKTKISSNTISWKAPAEGIYKLNFDGLGQPSLASAQHLGPNTIAMIEAQALQDALAFGQTKSNQEICGGKRLEGGH
ncbi:hypothetical protein D8674_026121 [Pyrus ussuriensis x Pyrus communis]|uniref:Uncharacterized protein n=1 Tax=Pyrus ussuriensis x Pyrus communis TaxID=2448454 RepID=A0A5N5I8P5_9ROSA|nr:hypothetical protein D8674_026121 [Pyrus ussuriensis x Pyrus communis]